MTLKITTLNVNGIRSAAQKGFFDWMLKNNIDIVCLQETRAQPEQLSAPVFHPEGYFEYFCPAEKPGYSGVAIYSRHKPKKVTTGLGWPHADHEGRYLELHFEDVSVSSIYLPSGTSGDERQKIKFDFLTHFLPVLKKMIASKRNYILCGDINIAHKPIDLKNWKANQKHSGFLPEERAWLDTLFDDVGFVDAFRALNQAPDQYTWWSNRGQARAKNVGWRIDYQLITPGLRHTLQKEDIFKAQRFSDHAPLTITYNLTV